MRIAIIDDQAYFAEPLVEILQRDGHEAVWWKDTLSNTTPENLVMQAQQEENKFDLILFDSTLDYSGQGTEFARLFKDSGLHVLTFSTQPSREHIEAGLRLSDAMKNKLRERGFIQEIEFLSYNKLDGIDKLLVLISTFEEVYIDEADESSQEISTGGIQ